MVQLTCFEWELSHLFLLHLTCPELRICLSSDMEVHRYNITYAGCRSKVKCKREEKQYRMWKIETWNHNVVEGRRRNGRGRVEAGGFAVASRGKVMDWRRC